MRQVYVGMLLVMVLAVVSKAETVTDKLCRDLPTPSERTTNTFNMTYDAGWGIDPLPGSDLYLAVTDSSSPDALYYSAGEGKYFDHFTVSFANMNNQCAFDLYDAQGRQVPVAPIWDHDEAGGAIKWYTITVYSDGYDFRQIIIKVWGPAGCGALGTVQLEKVPVYISAVTDSLNRDITAPTERSTVLNFTGKYDTTWQNDPLISPSTSPYVFSGISGKSYGYISYAVPAGEYINKLTASIAYIGGVNGVEIRDSGYNPITFTTTAATQDANGVWWYTVTFDRANNSGADRNYQGLYIVVYGGSWGFGYSTIGTVKLEKKMIPVVPTQNASFTVPAIAPITVNGTLTDWSASTDWSQPYIYWAGDGLYSQTRAKFAWNDAQDLLYVAIETNEGGSPQAGGHAVLGFSKDIHSAPSSGIGSTQICFDTVAGAGNTVFIQNEIDYFTTLDSSLGWPHAGTDGVQAAYSYDSGTGMFIYEIAVPLRSDWRVGHMLSKQTLSGGDVVYLYSAMEDELNGGNGMDLTWNGNPKFYAGAFNKAAVLTLQAPVRVPGDANGDKMVDVGDLGILAANYGGIGKSWEQGDFNGDGAVDVGDLGILAAHYGTNSNSATDWATDYAKAFGTTVSDDTAAQEETSNSVCSSLGLPLVAGLALMGLMLVKLEN
jgi:hypothetical protein